MMTFSLTLIFIGAAFLGLGTAALALGKFYTPFKKRDIRGVMRFVAWAEKDGQLPFLAACTVSFYLGAQLTQVLPLRLYTLPAALSQLIFVALIFILSFLAAELRKRINADHHAEERARLNFPPELSVAIEARDFQAADKLLKELRGRDNFAEIVSYYQDLKRRFAEVREVDVQLHGIGVPSATTAKHQNEVWQQSLASTQREETTTDDSALNPEQVKPRKGS